LTSGTEDKLGRALADLLENPLITGTIGRAFDARERAAQAQELALGALNIPTAADIERLTRRLRSVSQRLEGIEDGVHRINRALGEGKVERRLSAMEDQLKSLSGKLAKDAPAEKATSSAEVKPPATTAPAATTGKPSTKATPARKGTARTKAAAKRSPATKSAATRSGAARTPAKSPTPKKPAA
jgi:hypothetical protein